MTSSVCFCFFLLVAASAASPDLTVERNVTRASDAPHGYIVPGPSGRGTLSIIISSISTLGTCVWTAVHLNVPNYNKSSFFLRRLRPYLWPLAAMLIPEFLLHCALNQWMASRDLRQIINKIGSTAAMGKQFVCPLNLTMLRQRLRFPA